MTEDDIIRGEKILKAVIEAASKLRAKGGRATDGVYHPDMIPGCDTFDVTLPWGDRLRLRASPFCPEGGAYVLDLTPPQWLKPPRIDVDEEVRFRWWTYT